MRTSSIPGTGECSSFRTAATGSVQHQDKTQRVHNSVNERFEGGKQPHGVLLLVLAAAAEQ
jgi:hypothetical protein